jgi:hypothetical protein
MNPTTTVFLLVLATFIVVANGDESLRRFQQQQQQQDDIGEEQQEQPSIVPSQSPTETSGFIARLVEFFTFDTIYCEDNINLPACPHPTQPETKNGMWICRTLADTTNNRLIRQSQCINPLFSLVNQDECGCCNGICPELACPCTCAIGEVQGVSLAFTAPGDQQFAPSCFPNDLALKLRSEDTGFWTCLDAALCNSTDPIIGDPV